MRLAGSSGVYEALARHFMAADVPEEAAHHLAAEGAVHGSTEADLDRFFALYELLKSKGYSDSAAQHVAVEMLEGREPMAHTTRRYAGIYGDQPADPEDSGCSY